MQFSELTKRLFILSICLYTAHGSSRPTTIENLERISIPWVNANDERPPLDRGNRAPELTLTRPAEENWVRPNPQDINVFEKAGLGKDVYAQEKLARPQFLLKNSFKKQCLTLADGYFNPYIVSLFRFLDHNTKVCKDVFGNISYSPLRSDEPLKIKLSGRNIPLVWRNQGEAEEVSKLFCRILGYRKAGGGRAYTTLNNTSSPNSWELAKSPFFLIPQWEGYAYKLEPQDESQTLGEEYRYRAYGGGDGKSFEVGFFSSIYCQSPSPFRPFLQNAIGYKPFWNPFGE